MEYVSLMHSTFFSRERICADSAHGSQIVPFCLSGFIVTVATIVSERFSEVALVLRGRVRVGSL